MKMCLNYNCKQDAGENGFCEDCVNEFLEDVEKMQAYIENDVETEDRFLKWFFENIDDYPNKNVSALRVSINDYKGTEELREALREYIYPTDVDRYIEFIKSNYFN